MRETTLQGFLIALLVSATTCFASPQRDTNQDRGTATGNNKASQRQLLQSRAEQGDAVAQNALGNMFFKEAKDITQAEKWWLRAAEQGNAAAAASLGYLNSRRWYDKSGRKVVRHAKLPEERKWYLRAAELGHAHAQFVVATQAKHSGWVNQIREDMMKWLLRAAEQGYAPAQFELGWTYQTGYSAAGIGRDTANSVKWYRRAAESTRQIYGSRLERRAVARSQNHLGFLYFRGEGVPKDLVSAYAWLETAAKNGYEDKRDWGMARAPKWKVRPAGENANRLKWRDVVIPAMTPEQVAKGKALARELLAKYRTRAGEPNARTGSIKEIAERASGKQPESPAGKRLLDTLRDIIKKKKEPERKHKD